MNISRDNRLENAARWLVRFQDKDFTPEDQKELEMWLEKNPFNRKAFEEMNQVWDHVGKTEALSSFISTCEYEAIEPLHHAPEKQGFVISLLSLFFKPNKKMITASISLVILILFCLPVLRTYFNDPVEKFYSYRTSTGEQKTITLSDGSTLKMNVRSSVSVSMGKDYRRVQMNNGEVFFAVEPDTERPFEVYTSGGMVRVLGTAFNVRDRKGFVSVDVDHGKVEVMDAPVGSGDMRGSTITLIAGQGTDIDSGGRMTPLHLSDIKKVLAWQQKQVVFNNAPLNNVLQELEFYHNVNIKLTFRELGQKKITGTFDMNNLEETLDIIATAASLHIKKESGNKVTLSGEQH